jgi:mRNA interferase MazF
VLPAAGDIVWVELDPVLGTEQAGRRPAMILSGRDYHARSSRAIVCPITNTARDWPFDVLLPAGMKTMGFVLVDQVRTVHRPERIREHIEAAPANVLADVRGRLAALLGIT